MNPEFVKVAIKLLIGAVATAFGGTVLKQGVEDAKYIKKIVNA